MAHAIKNCPYKKSVCRYEGVEYCGTKDCPQKRVSRHAQFRKISVDSKKVLAI